MDEAILAAARDHAALAAALDPILTIDASGTIQSASESVERVFGWSAAELLGRNINILMPEPHHTAHDGYLSDYRRTGRTNIMGRTRQFEGVRKNGELFPLELSVARADPPGGGMPLFVGIIRDVSERVRLERELRLVQDLALSISSASDLSHALVETIRQIAMATQWDYGEAWGEDPGGEELVPAASWARPGSGLEEFDQTMRGLRLRRGSGMPGRAWVTGRPIWAVDVGAMSEAEFCGPRAAVGAGIRAAAAVPILSENVTVAVLLFFVRRTQREDVHLLELVRAAVAPLGGLIQRKRAEGELEGYRRSLEERVKERTRALQESQDKLRMADRLASIGTLAAGLGHDMNNVLLPVRARLDALRAEGATGGVSAPAGKHVEAIRKSVAYLQQLADGLHFLAMDPEREDDSRDSVDLAAWWAQAGPLISKAIPKHARVTASFPAGLPRAQVAEHGLTQAVLNLVVNAGEAIPPPAVRKRRQGLVRVSAALQTGAEGGPRVRLAVNDNGLGMSEQVRRRAFEMFFTTKTRGLGTGLGLALVHKVADRAGGSVEIDSQVGKGTTVTMVFRVASKEQSAGTAARPVAVISVGDGRAAAMLGHILAASGVEAAHGEDPGNADLWLVEPAASCFPIAKAWLERKPAGRLVLIGRPRARPATPWAALNPVTIENPGNLDALRSALGGVIPGA